MKIAYVFPSLAVWGGIERILTDKMNWLCRHGCEVAIITTDQGDHPTVYDLDPRIRHIDLGICFHHQYRYRRLHRLFDLWQRNRLFGRRLNVQLKQLQPDILVTAANGLAGLITQTRRQIPLVVESHTICQQLIGEGRLQALRRWRLLWQLKRADVLVALTEGDAEQWRRHVQNVVVIPDMVHVPERLQQATLKSRNVLFVGRLEPQKQVFRLIEAWRTVWNTHRDWTLTVCGDGSQREQLQQFIAEAAAEGIELVSPTRHVFSLYANTAMLVLTSSYEPFGLVMAEAMLCGVPVVAFDCPYGPRTIVSDGCDGLLVAPNSTAALAQAIARLMDDAGLRQRLGSAAAQNARRFEADQVMPLWEKLFQKRF